MANISVLLLLWSAICGCAFSRAIDSHSFVVERKEADRNLVNGVSALRRNLRQGNDELAAALGRSLYWFGNFSVGNSGYLRLLIDTGSSDLWLNTGVYKPSEYEQPYSGNATFSITYEGVNRKGFGFETINGTVQEDVVTAAGLTVTNQAMGNATSWKYIDAPQLPYADQGQGIIGFEGPKSSSFQPGARSWFYNLCHQNLIPEHRFGLAFGTSGTGQVVLGKLNKRLISGKITTLPNLKLYDSYTVRGDVTLDNKIVAANQTIIMDVGTDNIQGPIGVTRDILHKLGYQTHLYTSSVNPFDPGTVSKSLIGFFECDKPPTLGFSFPAQADLQEGQTAQIFNVSPLVWDVFEHKKQSNNCTSILGGTNALTDPKTGVAAWLLGQSFFAGHYIDFDLTSSTVSFAKLANPSG